MIVVVEPHADDAWLSLGQHLLDWAAAGESLAIVTVFGNAARLREARTYADYIGAAHRGIGLPEGNLGLGDNWTTEVPSSLLWAALDGWGGGRVLGPLGLQHPEHRATAAVVGGERYVELPYARKRKLEGEVNTLVGGRPVRSWKPRSAKANAPSSIFKTQAPFWFHHREEMIGAVEVIVGQA